MIKKIDPLKNVDLRAIAVAPRPPSVLDPNDDPPKPGERGVTRQQKLERAQAKAKEMKASGGYAKQYRVIATDSAGNEEITEDTVHSKPKRKKHHSHKKDKKKKGRKEIHPEA